MPPLFVKATPRNSPAPPPPTLQDKRFQTSNGDLATGKQAQDKPQATPIPNLALIKSPLRWPQATDIAPTKSPKQLPLKPFPKPVSTPPPFAKANLRNSPAPLKDITSTAINGTSATTKRALDKPQAIPTPVLALSK